MKITENDIDNLINQRTGKEVLFSPSRVLMQDYTGVPAVADLAARDKVKVKVKILRKLIQLYLSLIIDHSVLIVISKNSLFKCKERIWEKFGEIQIIKMGTRFTKNFISTWFRNLSQINIEFLAEVVSLKDKLLF